MNFFTCKDDPASQSLEKKMAEAKHGAIIALTDDEIEAQKSVREITLTDNNQLQRLEVGAGYLLILSDTEKLLNMDDIGQAELDLGVTISVIRRETGLRTYKNEEGDNCTFWPEALTSEQRQHMTGSGKEALERLEKFEFVTPPENCYIPDQKVPNGCTVRTGPMPGFGGSLAIPKEIVNKRNTVDEILSHHNRNPPADDADQTFSRDAVRGDHSG